MEVVELWFGVGRLIPCILFKHTIGWSRIIRDVTSVEEIKVSKSVGELFSFSENFCKLLGNKNISIFFTNLLYFFNNSGWKKWQEKKWLMLDNEW